MAVKRPINKEAVAKTSEQLWKIETRIYLLWILGIVVGALQLKPTSFRIIGATFSLEKPELIEGLLFAGCIMYYVGVFYLALLLPYSPQNSNLFRKAIWYGANRHGKPLKRVTKDQLWHIRLDARIAVRLTFWLAGIGALLPMAHILIFRREPLLTALKVILPQEL